MVTLNKKILRTFIVWLLIVPPGIFYLYLNYFPREIDGIDLFLFILLGLLTNYFYATQNGKPVFLVIWITIPTFLMYGVFIEVIVMQIMIIASLFIYKSPESIVLRYFFYSTLYFILSIASAFIFHTVGGEMGMLSFWPLIVTAWFYLLTHTLLNDFALRLFSLFAEKRSMYFSGDSAWDYRLGFLVLPYALILYYLLNFIGYGAFLLLGIPYFIIIFLIRLYNTSEKINESLQKVREIGHGLSHNLTEEHVLNQFVEKSAQLFNADYAYLYDHKEGWLEPIRAFARGVFRDPPLTNSSFDMTIAAMALKKKSPIMYAEKEEWLDSTKNQLHLNHDNHQSVLCVPISRNQEIEGVLLLSTERKHAFQDYQLKTLDLLSSYFTVSVENARYVEETVKKSERCALTKLYNYIYLEERLEKEMEKVQLGVVKKLSLLILDIDHFKMVNDTYGHQSGNDILVEFAGILRSLVPKDGIVARYGGEEFVYLLPEKSKTEAMLFAEMLRKKIGDHVFQIKSDLGHGLTNTELKITVSIGISTALEDADEAKVLLRNADRALYIGAKQAGRNRVANYRK